jgi:aspartokinase-like uncharacterized kinase
MRPEVPAIQAVVKIGGSLSRLPGALAQVGQILAQASEAVPLVVVPGGGPFAEAVRQFDEQIGLSSDAAHWMAILAMDQYAHALADFIPGSAVVESEEEVHEALVRRRIPILAPSRWLRATDELPHRWEVTSDSLAAYLAGLLGANRVVLLKPLAGPLEAVADPYFREALPAGMPCRVVGPSEFDRWREYLQGP